jgi:hypothetical protein
VSSAFWTLLYAVPFVLVPFLNPSRRPEPDSVPVVLSPAAVATQAQLRAGLVVGCLLLIGLVSHELFGEKTQFARGMEVLSDVFGGLFWLGMFHFGKAKTDFYNETGVHVPWPSRGSYNPGPNRALKASRFWKEARLGITLMLLSSCFPVFFLLLVVSTVTPGH